MSDNFDLDDAENWSPRQRERYTSFIRRRSREAMEDCELFMENFNPPNREDLRAEGKTEIEIYDIILGHFKRANEYVESRNAIYLERKNKNRRK